MRLPDARHRESSMKKEISPGVIIGAIIGLVVAIVAGVFFLVKSDPASQPPHQAPTFNAAAKQEESDRNPYANRAGGPNAPKGAGTGDHTMQ